MEEATMRVLVCGSRDFNDAGIINIVLDGLHCAATDPATGAVHLTIIEGGAKGADSIAGLWATASSLPNLHFPAQWDVHGKAAGPIRNQQMLDEGKPTEVWAFINKPLAQSKGTYDMVTRAKKAGLPVHVVEKM